jgi:serine/threonine protein kinase
VHRPGDIIDERYQLTRPLGKRGSAEIWEAEHEVVGRKVNLKLLAGDVALDPLLRERFIREARAASVVAHPSAVEVYDVGVTPDGIAYLVTEPLGGEMLSDLVARSAGLAVEDACQVAVQILEGLDAAHTAGIVHGALSPASVVLRRGRGEQLLVKILDLGTFPADTPDASGEPSVHPDADLRALGAILYEMLTGQPAFPERASLASTGTTGEGHAALATLPPAVPAALGDLVSELLAKESRARVHSAREMAKLLQQFTSPRRPSVAPRESAMPFLSPEARRSRGMARLERAVLGKSDSKANPGANVVIIGAKGESSRALEGSSRPRVDLEEIPIRAMSPGGTNLRERSDRPISSSGRRLDPADLIEPRIPRPPRTPKHFASARPADEDAIAPARVRLPPTRRRSTRVRQRLRLQEKVKSPPGRWTMWAGLLAAASLGAGLLIAHFLHF